jgi:hypothetical protein
MALASMKYDSLSKSLPDTASASDAKQRSITGYRKSIDDWDQVIVLRPDRKP